MFSDSLLKIVGRILCAFSGYGHTFPPFLTNSLQFDLSNNLVNLVRQ